MRIALAAVVFAAQAVGQVGPFGVPFDKKGKIEVRGKTFELEGGSQLIADNQDVLYESCIIRPKAGLGTIRVAGKVRFRGCLLQFLPGLAHLGFMAEGNGSIVFESCVIGGAVQCTTSRDYMKGGTSRGTILFDRCRFEGANLEKLMGVDDTCSINLGGGGISFRSCDFNQVSSIEAVGTAGPVVLPDSKKKADEVVIDAKNCWWNNADEAGVRAKIKDRTTGHTTTMGEKVNARVVFIPMAKEPFTTKLKPSEEKKDAAPEKK